MSTSEHYILLIEPNVQEADRILGSMQHIGLICHWSRSLSEAQEQIRREIPRAILVPDSLVDRIDVLDTMTLIFSQDENKEVRIPIIAVGDEPKHMELRGLSGALAGTVPRTPFDAEQVRVLVRASERIASEQDPDETLTILIVEDDPFLSELMSVKFQEANHTVLTCDSGEGVAEMITNKRPDIILLDLLLPGRNGVEVLADLKALDDTKTIPVIIVSNFSQQADVDRARELGADGYILKASASPTDIMNETLRVIQEHKDKHEEVISENATSADVGKDNADVYTDGQSHQ